MMMGMLAAASAAKEAAPELKKEPKSEILRRELDRTQRQLRDCYKDLCLAGDDPYDMGQAFVAEGGADSDDEYPTAYEKTPIRTETGDLLPLTAERLMDVFAKYDEDDDHELSFSEFRHFLFDGGVLEEFAMVCRTEEEYKASIAKQFSVVPKSGNLVFETFLELLEKAWSDEEIVRICAGCGIEVRYACSGERYRILNVFKQCGINDKGRVPAANLQLLAYESGVMLSDGQAREIALNLVGETKKIDRTMMADADKEGVGVAELEELSSDEDAHKVFKRKAIKGLISLQAYLKWWTETGYPKSIAQRTQLAGTNAPLPVRFLKLHWFCKSFVNRHLRAASVLMREHTRHAINAGVFDRYRPRTTTASRTRLVASAYCGRPKSAATLEQTMEAHAKSRRVKCAEALELVNAPEGAKGFIEIAFEPEEYVNDEELEDLMTAFNSSMRMDFGPSLYSIPGIMKNGISARIGADGEEVFVFVMVFFDAYPLSVLDPLREYLKRRVPPIVKKASMTTAEARSKVRSRVTKEARPLTAGTVGSRVSTAKEGVRGQTSISKRAQTRQQAKRKAAELAETDAGIAQRASKLEEPPKDPFARELFHDIMVRFTSSYNGKDWFGPGFSLKRAVEFKLDIATEFDPAMMAAVGEVGQRGLDYIEHQWALQTGGEPSKVPAHASASEKTDAANWQKKKRWAFEAMRWAFTTMRRLERVADVQLKWQAEDIGQVVKDSRFLRKLLGRERYKKLVAAVETKGWAHQWRLKMHKWLFGYLGTLKKAAISHADDLGGGSSSSSSDDDDEDGGAGAGAGTGTGGGGGGGAKARTVRIYRLGARAATALKGPRKLTIQIGDLRVEGSMNGMDFLSVLHPDKEQRKARRRGRTRGGGS